MAHRSRPTSDRRHCETCQPISEACCCASRQADTRSRFHTRSCRQATLVSDQISHPPSPSVYLFLSLSLFVCVFPPPPIFNPTSPLPFCLQRGGPSACLQQEKERDRATSTSTYIVGAGAGVCAGGLGYVPGPCTVEDPLHRSDPPPPSSYLVIFCCHSCTAPSSTVPCRACSPAPVHKSSPCIFISNRSRLHHPQPCLFSQSLSSSFSLPQPPRISSPLVLVSFFLFSLLFPFYFPIFLFS